MGESVMKSVRPVVSTRLKAPGDMDENIVSKMSKLPSSPLLDIELSRQVLNSGSLISNRLGYEVGVKEDRGALVVEEGMLPLLKPLVRL